MLTITILLKNESIKIKRLRQIVIIPIPIEAIIWGSFLSESLPAKGEKIAIAIGWAIKSTPVSFAE